MKNILKKLFILFIIILSLLFLYLKYGGYIWMDQEERDQIVIQIKQSPELPDQFYQIYNSIYPQSLNQSVLDYLIERESDNLLSKQLNSNINIFLEVVAIANLQTRFRVSRFQEASYLENFVTPKECLNFWSSKVYFKDGVVGIKNGCTYLFNKNLEDLTDDELIELIVVMQNSLFYNKKKRPDVVERKIKNIKEKIHYAGK